MPETEMHKPFGYSSLTIVRIAITVVTAVCILFQPVFGANPGQIENYDNDLVQAVESIIDSGFLTNNLTHYIPGYGLHVILSKASGSPKLNDIIEPISAALLQQSDTIKGLPEGEWVSVFYSADGFRNYDLLVRVKRGQPDTLEVWVDGLPNN